MQSMMIDHMMVGRRAFLACGTTLALSGSALAGSALAGSALAAGSAAASLNGLVKPRAGGLDFSDPYDNLYMFGKIWAGYEAPVIGAFHGMMYARFGTQRMVPVFNFVGLGVLQAEIDGQRYLKLKSRECAFFTDLRTGEILETWDNPFTGKTVEVYHFYNKGGGGRFGPEIPKFVIPGNPDTPTLMNEGSVFADANGKYPFILPFEQYGDDDLLLAWDYTHYHRNPVTPEGWPQSSTGSHVAPAEHFTIKVSRRALENRSLPTVPMYAGFSRSSQFWPFMQMGGTPYADGILSGRMHSHKGLKGFGEVPRKVLDYVERHAPEYLEIPQDWPQSSPRLDTWTAYAQDVPPETPGYSWSPSNPAIRPPTGKGRVRS